MGKTIYVDCPFCKGMMELDTQSGKIVQKWEPGTKGEEEGDKMSSVLKKLEEAKEKRKSLFTSKQQELQSKKEKLSGAFQDEIERAKKEGVDDKPLRPFDLD